MAKSKKELARPKQKWTSKEEEALSGGVGRYGEGKWKLILDDPQFGSSLNTRSNVDLKDKWRNMTGTSEHMPRRRTHKACRKSAVNDLSITVPGPSSRPMEMKRKPRYKVMIYEALSAFEDPNGTSVNTIASFLQGRYELPKNFRRLLTARLRQLMLSGELEKVNKRYRVKGRSLVGETSQQVLNLNAEDQEPPRLPSLNGEGEERPRLPALNEPLGPQHMIDENEEPVETLHTQTLEDAACVAAYHMDAAETSVSCLIKDCEDKKKLMDLLDESMSMLTVVEDLYQKCVREGMLILPP